MKNLILVLIAASLLFACKKSELETKKEELEKLQKEQSSITGDISKLEGTRKENNEKILKLETEIAKLDTSIKKDIRAKTIVVTPVATQAFQHFVEVQGKVDADQNIMLSAKMGGAVTRVNVQVGDAVRAGQVLAEIDNSLIVQGIEELKSGLAFATNVYNKQKNLWNQKIGSEIQFLTAKNNKESLEKRLATMYEQLDMTRIKSPITGTVDDVLLKVGQTIAPGMPSVRVVNLSRLKAKAEVPEAYAAKIKENNPVIVYFPDIKKEVQSKVSFAGRVINPTNRTFTVEVDLDPSKNEYHPNMISVLRIVDYENKNSIVIPVNMVQHSETGSYVMVAGEKNGVKVAVRRPIVLGNSYNGLTEVKEGLDVGDQLITTGYLSLNDGDRIKL